MRSFSVFAVFVGLGALYLWQRHNEAATTPAPTTPSAVVSSSTPAPTRTVSEHDWMKRSLDRAAAVRDEARARTKEAQDP